MDINKLNIQIGVFVRQLRSCSNQKLIEINDKTVDLLMEITRLSDKLMANAKVTPRTDNDNVNFIFDLDETHFEIRQFITCRLCAVSFTYIFIPSKSFFLNPEITCYRIKLGFQRKT